MDSPVKRPISPIKVSKKDMMDMEKEITKPTLKARVAQSTSQEAALAKLMAERASIAKKTGMWPTDEQVMKSRKR